MRKSAKDPMVLFSKWFEAAQASPIEDATAMTLATAGKDGIPHARLVLLKGFSANGFVFYTNLESDKGKHLAENPYAALCFHWWAIKRQVRIEGRVEPVSDEEADAYFNSRPVKSRLGAWASTQSRSLSSMNELRKRVVKYGIQFAKGNISRPSYWSGFRVIPFMIEFWEERPYRLHRRERYCLEEGASWRYELLY